VFWNRSSFIVPTLWKKRNHLNELMQVSCWSSTKRAFSNEINLESNLESKDTSSRSNPEPKDLLWKQSGTKRYKFKKQSGIKRFAVKSNPERYNFKKQSEPKDFLWKLSGTKRFAVKAIWNQKIQVQEAIWNQKIRCENNLESKDTSSRSNLESKDTSSISNPEPKDTSSGSNLEPKDSLWEQSRIKRCCENKWKTLDKTLVRCAWLFYSGNQSYLITSCDYLLDRQEIFLKWDKSQKMQQKDSNWKAKTVRYHDTDQLSAELSDWSLLIGRAITICFVIKSIYLQKKEKKKQKKQKNQKTNKKTNLCFILHTDTTLKMVDLG